MEYRRLGNSGLQVSALGMGTNVFGTDVDEAGADRIVGQFIDEGANFIDTADTYPPYGRKGSSEELVGKALKGGRRDKIVLATKFWGRMGEGPNDAGGSRHYVLRAVEDSLRRLDTDHIDLYQMHRPDPNTPIDETLSALDGLVTAGKVRYIGCSGYAGWQLVDALWTSREQHLAPFVSVQPEYNLLSRGIEKELIPACQKFGVGIIPYWPLAGGFLTGKYQRGQNRPADSRGGKRPQMIDRWESDQNWAAIDGLNAFATTQGHSLAELALAWLLARPNVSTVISGVSRAQQVTANARATEWKLTADDMKAIEAILNPPE